MFKFLKKPKQSLVVSPVTGKCVDLIEVPDKMFRDKMLGDGVAFIFDGEIVSAPVSGKISMIANTKHAFGIVDDNELEILVHIGLDTVNLNGLGFEVLVKSDEKVKAGTPIIKIDRKLMAEKGINLITPLIVTNSNDFILISDTGKEVYVGDQVITAEKR